ncbi:hypothetical protein CLI91_10830 [Lentilactobacillus hilgardii]|nr:hypothetical protein [Lentilactobacillus hilgardii]MBZ2204748.1 hypothetical protein [Lentilactobacillus hilgardii]
MGNYFERESKVKNNQLIHLTGEKRKHLISKLTDEQRRFLNEHRRYRMQSNFLNASLSDGEKWQLYDFKVDPDVSGKLTCRCGRTLKYQYIIQDQRTKQTQKLGINHFQEHMDVPENIAKQVAKGLQEINTGIDEILVNTFLSADKPSDELIEFVRRSGDAVRYGTEFLSFIDIGLVPYRKIVKDCENRRSSMKMERKRQKWVVPFQSDKREKTSYIFRQEKQKASQPTQTQEHQNRRSKDQRLWLKHYREVQMPKAEEGLNYLDQHFNYVDRMNFTSNPKIGKYVLGFASYFMRHIGKGSHFAIGELTDFILQISYETDASRSRAFEELLNQVQQILILFIEIGFVDIFDEQSYIVLT